MLPPQVQFFSPFQCVVLSFSSKDARGPGQGLDHLERRTGNLREPLRSECSTWIPTASKNEPPFEGKLQIDLRTDEAFSQMREFCVSREPWTSSLLDQTLWGLSPPVAMPLLSAVCEAAACFRVVLVPEGCRVTGWLKTTKCIPSQFWRLEALRFQQEGAPSKGPREQNSLLLF